MLDTSHIEAKLAAPKKKTASTKHVQEANEALEALGDNPKRRGEYLSIFKQAAVAFTDLKEPLAIALSGVTPKGELIEHKGKYFLGTARRLLGITKGAKRARKEV